MIKDRWSIDNQITVRVGERLENSALPFSGRHPIVLTWCFLIKSHLKKPRKSNEHERDSFTSRVENLRCCNKYIFAQLSHPITYGRRALNTISCGVLLTGREESGANNFAPSENQAMGVWTGGANIFIFALRQEYLESRDHLWSMQRRQLKSERPFANGCKSAKNQLLSAKMLFCLELIYDTLAWHFRTLLRYDIVIDL